MFPFSFFRKKRVDLIEEELRKAREEAYRYATEELAHMDADLMRRNYITQEGMNAELKAIAKKIAKLGY